MVAGSATAGLIRLPRLLTLSLLSLLLLPVTFGAEDAAETSIDLERILSFEGPHTGAVPEGWGGGPPGTLFVDDRVVHGGSWSGRIERSEESPKRYSTLSHSIPVDFKGATLELRGFLKTRNVEDEAGLWLRADGEVTPVAWDFMKDRPVRGTTEWTEYSLRIPLEETAVTIVFGALLSGPGEIWVDDLRLLVDGLPVKDAPRFERPKTVLETDLEFDGGSKVTIETLSPLQTASLATLGKVWGFLKYHHPKVVQGEVHWDYELFRVMPKVLQAADRAAARGAILAWARRLGEVGACDPCAAPTENAHLRPDLDWIHDRTALGEDLSAFLETVHRGRLARDRQAYVAQRPSVGNPVFPREKGYEQFPLPDAGYRILALFRWWNVVQYWSPYRDLIGADWHAVLLEFLPRMVAASEQDRYRQEILAVTSRLNDGHTFVRGALDARPPRGECRIPVRLRIAEGKPVVTGFTHPEKGPASGLKIGDVLLSLDGVSVDALVAAWTPYYSASNQMGRLYRMSREMTRGSCGSAKVRVERGGAPVKIDANRVPEAEVDLLKGWTHDLAGPSFRRLSEKVAYLKLSEVKVAEIPDYLRGAEGSKGLVVDIRNYPSEFVVFALGGHFVSETTPFARFTEVDLANPGATRWTDPPTALDPVAPHYPGKVVILVDECSGSQAEYTAMALRAAPNAIVVGSTTAGADGNISNLPLPGGLSTYISGIGVFYPDRRPTQRVGIVPDVEVRPTIASIREGRDPVLEAALRQILGEDTPDARIRELAGPPAKP